MFNTRSPSDTLAFLTTLPQPLLQALSKPFKSIQNPALPAILLVCLMSLTVQAVAKEQPQQTLPSVDLIMAGKTLLTEIASTPNQRYMGLSFRKSMAENEAMLFVFPTQQQLFFTMRNTLIPLSIAYISEELVILEIHQMPVGPDQVFPSKAPAKYALEVNQGWFKRHSVNVGTKISLNR